MKLSFARDPLSGIPGILLFPKRRVVKFAFNKMEQTDIDLPNAKLAYTIIQSLLEGHEALSDLLVLMSHALDEEVLKALTNTGQWQNYLESKRNMENVGPQLEKLTEELKKMDN